MVRKHCTIPYYALSHIFSMCQHNSDVVETSLKGSVCIFIISLYKSHQYNGTWSNKIVQVKNTLEPDVEEYPTFTPDDIGLLFGDIASPTGFILNKSDPREWLCYIS